MNQQEHIPVMLPSVLEMLDPQPGQVFVDGTLGLGGHAREILKKLGKNGTYIGFDKDTEALKKAEKILSDCEGSLILIHDSFAHIAKHLHRLNIDCVDGMLLDLGSLRCS